MHVNSFCISLKRLSTVSIIFFAIPSSFVSRINWLMECSTCVFHRTVTLICMTAGNATVDKLIYQAVKLWRIDCLGKETGGRELEVI